MIYETMLLPSSKTLLIQAENIHSKAFEITLNAVGVQMLLQQSHKVI